MYNVQYFQCINAIIKVFLVHLIQHLYFKWQVDEYLTERGSEQEQELAADYTLQILDVVLKSEHSLNNQQVIEQIKVNE